MLKRPFIPGLELCGFFYQEAVRPILERRFAGLEYSAARIGAGSDVLGFDTPQSMDHDWGPRVKLFLRPEDYEAYREAIDRALRQELPGEIRGYPTNFGYHEDRTTVMAAATSGPINHLVTIHTVQGFCQQVLGFDPAGDMRAADWLSVSENHLLMLTAGRVYHDGLGELEPIRAKLRYYPHDVWLYLLAAQWRRIDQEEPFMGRCGQVGDGQGSALIAARLVRDVMRLCFLMERRYAPYIKWFGTAFARLDCAADLMPTFTGVLQGKSWQERQTHLTVAYEHVARMHNALGITDPMPTEVSHFWNRPFLVIHADRFVDAILAQIKDKEVLALPEHLGSLDQFVDSTDAVNHFRRFRPVFGAES
jgi:hypothetical protein